MIEERHEIYANGVLVSVTDTRTLAGEKARRIEQLKIAFSDSINEAYPPYKQSNAALGIMDAAEAEALRLGIQNMRIQYEAKKSAINNASDLQELDTIYDDNFTLFLTQPDALTAKITEVDALLRSKLNNSTFTHNGGTFRYHPSAQLDATSLVASIATYSPIPWEQTNGSQMNFATAEDFMAFASAMRAHGVALNIAAKTHLYALSQLNTVQDILNYDTTAGW